MSAHDDERHRKNQAQLRKLAAHASYAVHGTWPQYDPWPDHIDELCDKLREMGVARELAAENSQAVKDQMEYYF